MPYAQGLPLLPCRRWGVAGPGRPVLVMLHGLYGHSAQWWPYARALRGAFDVLALDARNHGRAFRAPTQRHEEMAGDVVRTLDALGVRDFWLLGHSMGARVAMLLAQREARRVRGCVSLDAPILGGVCSDKLARYHQRAAALLREARAEEGLPREALRRELLGRGLDRQMAGYALRNYVFREGQWGWQVGFEGIADYVENRLSELMDPAPIGCPFLQVEAGRSILCRHTTEEMFAGFAPRGARVVDGEATHLSLLFRPSAAAVEWLWGKS